jgi:hypothetical protein
VDTWQNHKVGTTWLTGGYESPREESQCSVDFSHLEDSRDKSVKARRFNLRGCE